MSKIQLDPELKLICPEFHDILKVKIISVCNKIGFDDSQVVWWIFDPTNTSSNRIPNNLLIGKHGRDYGYCDFRSNEIWISTLALRKSMQEQNQRKRSHILGYNKSCEDFLADVIIDEITHLQTKSHHGTTCYINKYRDNHRLYYSSSCATLI